MTKKYKCKKKVLINVESKKKRKINIFRVINYFLLSLNRITTIIYYNFTILLVSNHAMCKSWIIFLFYFIPN